MNWIFLSYITILGAVTSLVAMTIFFIYTFPWKSKTYLAEGKVSGKKVPSFGGFLIFPGLFLGQYLFYFDPKIVTIYLSAILFGIIGFIDDWLKNFKNIHLSMLTKFFLHTFAGIITSIYWYNHTDSTILNLFFWQIDLGVFYFLWTFFVILIGSYGVNITHESNGLGIYHSLLILIFGLPLSQKFYSLPPISINSPFHYFYQIIILSMAMAGNLNLYPTKIRLGNVGCQSLGAIISAFFIIFHMELMLPIIGIFFTIEYFSIIFSYLYYIIYKINFLVSTPLSNYFKEKEYSPNNILVYSLISVCLFYGLLFLLFKILS